MSMTLPPSKPKPKKKSYPVPTIARYNVQSKQPKLDSVPVEKPWLQLHGFKDPSFWR